MSGNLINKDIRAKNVRLVGEGYNGDVVSLSEALQRAEEAGLDLVQVAFNQDDNAGGTAICKIIDYSKLMYNQQKKAKQNKKNKQDTKEIRLSDNIAENDIKTKAKNADKFISAGDRVVVSVVYRGRMLNYISRGFTVLKTFESYLTSSYKVDKPAKIEGNKVVMTLVQSK